VLSIDALSTFDNWIAGHFDPFAAVKLIVFIFFLVLEGSNAFQSKRASLALLKRNSNLRKLDEKISVCYGPLLILGKRIILNSYSALVINLACDLIAK